METHVYFCNTRWGDLDAQGHVNNVRMIQYVQEAAIDLLRSALPESLRAVDVMGLPGGIFIVHHTIDYHTPLEHGDDPLPIQVWVERIGRTSFRLACEGRRNGTAIFTSSTVVVARDQVTGEPRPLDEVERAFLAANMPGWQPLDAADLELQELLQARL